jgi:hypothetical protein
VVTFLTVLSNLKKQAILDKTWLIHRYSTGLPTQKRQSSLTNRNESEGAEPGSPAKAWDVKQRAVRGCVARTKEIAGLRVHCARDDYSLKSGIEIITGCEKSLSLRRRDLERSKLKVRRLGNGIALRKARHPGQAVTKVKVQSRDLPLRLGM